MWGSHLRKYQSQVCDRLVAQCWVGPMCPASASTLIEFWESINTYKLSPPLGQHQIPIGHLGWRPREHPFTCCSIVLRRSLHVTTQHRAFGNFFFLSPKKEGKTIRTSQGNSPELNDHLKQIPAITIAPKKSSNNDHEPRNPAGIQPQRPCRRRTRVQRIHLHEPLKRNPNLSDHRPGNAIS